MISDFQKQTNETIWSFLRLQVSMRRTSIMDVKGYSPATDDMPTYLYVTNGETVILCIDWQSKPVMELADEEGVEGRPPSYYSGRNSRLSPVWRLAEFTRQYKQSLSEEGIRVPQVWSILLTNSTVINYNEMTDCWRLMHISVLHAFSGSSQPQVYLSTHFFKESLAQHKALRSWCDRQGFLHDEPHCDSYDNDLDDSKIECDLDDDDPDNLFLQGSVALSQGNIVKVEVLQPMDNPKEKLNSLVGCDNIKRQISDLLELSSYNHWMHICYPEWKQHNVSLHAIFFGHPGTGKTTVSKIYGALLKQAGVLSKGHVVVCNRGTFLGSNWGDEEKAIRQVLEMSKGGVLMIDEAYLLNSNHPNDPGKLIVPQLMDILANEHERDIAIILCGYKEPMQELLDLNPGLASRFPNRYEFEDFSIEDLVEISFRRLEEYNYHFTRTALRKYKSLLSAAYAVRDPQTWGNARFVANQLEHIYLLHAKRCMKQFPKVTQFFSITSADIQPIEVPKEKKRIGFQFK